MADRDIRVRFRGDTRDLDAAFGRVRRGANQTDQSVQGIGKSFGALKGAIVASGVLVVGSQMVRLGKQMFDLGSAVEETGSKFRTVFGQNAGAVDGFIASFGRLAGVTQSEGQNLLATTGAIAQGFGFAQAESAKFAQQIFRTAADMASFNNLPTDDVLNRITAALAGERESMKRLGVVITEAEVQQKAFDITGKSVAKTLTAQDKALASLELITNKAAVAMGDLERTQDSSANVAKKAAGDFRQLKEDIAVVIKDALVPLLVKISELGTWLNENRAEVRKWATFFVTAMTGAINIVIQSFERYLALLNTVRGLGQAAGGIFSGNQGAIGAGLQRAGQGVSDFADASARTARELRDLFSAMDRAESAANSLVPSVARATGTSGSGSGTSATAGKGLLGLAHAAGVANEAHKQLFITLRQNTGNVDATRLIGTGIEELGVSARHTMTAWEEMWAANARGLEGADEGLRSFVDDIAQAVRTALDFGGALGFISDSAARAVNSMVNLAQGVKGLMEATAAGAATGGHIGAIVAAGSNLLGQALSVFGGGPSFDDRVKDAMDRLAVSATLLRQDFQKLSSIAKQLAEAQTLGPLRQLAGSGIGLDRFSSITTRFGADPFNELKAELDKLGLSFLDLANAASAIPGVEIGNLLQVLITGKGDIAAAKAELDTFLGIIKDLPDPIRDLADAARQAADTIRVAAGTLGQVSNIPGGATVSDLVGAFTSAVRTLVFRTQGSAVGGGSFADPLTGLDPTTVAGRSAITSILRNLFLTLSNQISTSQNLLASGRVQPGALQAFQNSLNATIALRDLVTQIQSTIDQIDTLQQQTSVPGTTVPGTTVPGTGIGSTSNLIQFPQVTEIQAGEMIAAQRTTEFHTRRAADGIEQWLPVIANALTGGQFAQVVSQNIAAQVATGP